ncbi:hypothetical protein COW46_02230 [Candidatus Gracilibacteria bacterium CG17_big_fil_post_rev_8_21_14_2_50_48_13]|nr:MAG: hypothetical protein COW46_02230 [Candidatus Gracilibacteria bacterium CG17_big_fil_post_rev_8_21_14_2_50_48_13]
MNKAILGVTLTAALLATTGCVGAADESSKIQAMLVETICMSSDAVASMTSMDFTSMSADELTKAQADIEAKGKEMQEKMKDMPKKYGFETEEAAENAFKKISDKEAFRKTVSDEATKKCNPKPELLNDILAELK